MYGTHWYMRCPLVIVIYHSNRIQANTFTQCNLFIDSVRSEKINVKYEPKITLQKQRVERVRNLHAIIAILLFGMRMYSTGLTWANIKWRSIEPFRLLVASEYMCSNTYTAHRCAYNKFRYLYPFARSISYSWFS